MTSRSIGRQVPSIQAVVSPAPGSRREGIAICRPRFDIECRINPYRDQRLLLLKVFAAIHPLPRPFFVMADLAENARQRLESENSRSEFVAQDSKLRVLEFESQASGQTQCSWPGPWDRLHFDKADIK
ncbi:MAG: hypothetical protein ABI407_22370 [Bradyrhizobium sp.]